jgi:hypothetical protein
MFYAEVYVHELQTHPYYYGIAHRWRWEGGELRPALEDSDESEE